MGCREPCGEAYAENLSHAECSLGQMDLMPYSSRALDMLGCIAMSISSSRPMARTKCQLVSAASEYGYHERQQRRPAEAFRSVAGEG